jgi:glutamate-1-semialdehyde 2,1-aminomutase
MRRARSPHKAAEPDPASNIVPGAVATMLNDSRSAELYARARTLLVGGVNSPVRAMHAIGRDPIFIERGAGAEIVDVDGNAYVDYVCSWGALIAGHAHPAVLAAVAAAAARGTSFGAPTALEVALAEQVAARVPGAEMLRMTSSGTEAAMTAIRLARARTGRDVVIKFAGAYHGHSDGLLSQAGSGVATQGIPSSPGVPEATAAATVVVPWNDGAALELALERHEVAAIIAEPCPANMGLVPAAAGFLELLRERSRACGALLISDEVISGFRVARGGEAERSGVQGDLVVLGKVLGGGLPAAALAGPRELLELLAPVGEVYQAGTLSGNPLALAAGLATLELLDGAAYARLEATTRALAEGLAEAAGGRAVSVVWVPGLLTVFFAAAPPQDFAGAQACDLVGYGAWCRELLARGVYPPPSQFEAWFPSLAHTEEQIEATVAAARSAFAAIDGAR